jgi:hypothetical protein
MKRGQPTTQLVEEYLQTLLTTAIEAYAFPKLMPTMARRAGPTGVVDMDRYFIKWTPRKFVRNQINMFFIVSTTCTFLWLSDPTCVVFAERAYAYDSTSSILLWAKDG